MTEEIPEQILTFLGTVLAVQANYYKVQLDLGVGEPESGRVRVNSSTSLSHHFPILLCTRRTRLKKIGQQVMVGDRVVIEEPDWAGQRGAIADVLPRKNLLDRP
ncbi:MAG: ribosome small subunit-dependent GTPase, partial [Fischerella sp.]|nr:ribosome small subunit-dependent GTPase [Fischerella sp.]